MNQELQWNIDFGLAPKDKMLLLDIGLTVPAVGHWSELHNCWVYATPYFNSHPDKSEVWFKNVGTKTPFAWMNLPATQSTEDKI